MNEKSLKELAAEKRREYRRAWYAKNRDKCREHTSRYWERKVLKSLGEVQNDSATSRT